jgi:hypothetical protein
MRSSPRSRASSARRLRQPPDDPTCARLASARVAELGRRGVSSNHAKLQRPSASPTAGSRAQSDLPLGPSQLSGRRAESSAAATVSQQRAAGRRNGPT